MLLQSLATLLQWFWGHFWALALISVLIGFLLGGLAIAARFHTIKQYIKLVESTAVEEIHSTFLGVRIVCRQSFASKSATATILNLPPPPLRSTGTLNPSEIVLAGSDEYIYYIPQTPDPAMPKGIGFPATVRLVYGNPPIPELTQILPVGFITVPTAGIWIPSRVGPNNVSLSMKEFLSRKSRRESRNFYILDYVEQGDCVGFIQPTTKKSVPLPVFADISGDILQFGAYERTALVPGASVMLIAKLEVQCIRSPEVGTFFDSKDGKPLAELGTRIKAGQIIGIIKHLGFEEKIAAPCDLVLLRSFVHAQKPEKGVPVEYNGKLFSYRIFDKSPT